MDADDACEDLLSQMRAYVEYWAAQDQASEREKLEGLAFSLLNIIDGTSAIDGFDLVRGGHVVNVGVMLHEQWYK